MLASHNCTLKKLSYQFCYCCFWFTGVATPDPETPPLPLAEQTQGQNSDQLKEEEKVSVGISTTILQTLV